MVNHRDTHEDQQTNRQKGATEQTKAKTSADLGRADDSLATGVETDAIQPGKTQGAFTQQ